MAQYVNALIEVVVRYSVYLSNISEMAWDDVDKHGTGTAGHGKATLALNQLLKLFEVNTAHCIGEHARNALNKLFEYRYVS